MLTITTLLFVLQLELHFKYNNGFRVILRRHKMIKRSTKKSLFFAVLVTILFSLGFAQQTSKIGIVNSNEVLEKSIEGKKVIAQVETKNKKNQGELAKIDDEIRKLQTKLNTQRLTLTNEAMMQLNSDLQRKQTERKRFAEDSYNDMQEFTARLFQRVQGELLPIIEQVGKEKNLDLIFDLLKSGTIYFNPAINITEDVIKKYDASKASQK